MILGATPTAAAAALDRPGRDPAATSTSIRFRALRLLAAELAEARNGQRTAAPSDLTAVPLGAEARRDADSELSSAIVLSPDHAGGPAAAAGPAARDRAGAVAAAAAAAAAIRPRLDRPRRAVRPRTLGARSEEVLDAPTTSCTAGSSRHGLHSIFGALRRLLPLPDQPPGGRQRSAGLPSRCGRDGRLAARRPPSPSQALSQQILKSATPDVALDDLQKALLEWGTAARTRWSRC